MQRAVRHAADGRARRLVGGAVTHPITQTLRRGRNRRHAGCHLGLRIGTGGADRVSLATLAADGERLRAMLDRLGREIGTDRSDVQASLFLEVYTWRLVLPLAGALVAEQRVAAPTAHDVTLRPGKGHGLDLRLNPARFTALQDDAAAAHPDASLAPTRVALARAFERALIDHFEVIIDALNGSSGRAARALWRTVSDRTAMALLYAGLACRNHEIAEGLAHEVLRGIPPLQSTPVYATVPTGDCWRRVHVRHGCCLWWRTAAAEYCSTCPLRHRAEAAHSSETDSAFALPHAGRTLDGLARDLTLR